MAVKHKATKFVLFVLIALIAWSIPSHVQAHAALLSSDPPANALLTAAPRKITLTFNESVTPVRDGIVVVSPEGETVQERKARTSKGGKELSSTLPLGLPQGTFLVSYRVVSADGHPVTGGYSFSVGKETKTPQLPGEANEDVDSWVLGVYSVAKYATYAGAVLLAGPVIMLLFLWPRRLPIVPLRRVGWTGWWLLLGGTALWLIVQVPYSFGGAFWGDKASVVDGEAIGETLTSAGGIALISRLILILLAFLPLHILFRQREWTSTQRLVVGVMAAIALLTWPMAGHAAAAEAAQLIILAGAAHMGAVAFWLGGLIVLAAFLLPKANDEESAAILPTWSRWALWAIATIAFTGVVQALLETNSLSALGNTTYGYLVIAKILGLMLIMAIAAFARKRALRSPNELDRRKLRRLIVGEIAVAVVVLGLATSLTQTPPVDASSQSANSLPYTSTVDGDGYRLQIDVNPAVVGRNTLHLYTYGDSGEEVPVEEWKTSVELPGRDVAPVSVRLLAISEGHASGEIYLPIAGEWVFRITVRTSDVDQMTVEKVILIRKE